MRIVQDTAAFIKFYDLTDEEFNFLNEKLQYKDLSNQYKYLTAKNRSYQWQNDSATWHQYVNDLKNSIIQCLLKQKKDYVYTYSGLKEIIFENLKFFHYEYTYENKIKYPEFENLPYDIHYKPLKLYKYQEEAIDALLQNPHSCIELPTGSGKQFVIENLVKRTGLPSLIVVPSKSIAYQFYHGFIEAFGKKYVGLFGDGKKEYKKHIVIGISDSISLIEDDTEAYDVLSKKSCLIFDESHLVGAPTVASIAAGIGANIPYRWSVSATQLRIDGKDLLLSGIIGKIVYLKSFRELVEIGALADLHFHIYNVNSPINYHSSNPSNIMRRHHLFNETILNLAAKIANLKYQQNESTLILIDEIKQMDILKNYLTVPYEFAHADSDIDSMVNNFNNKKTLLLIGTKAINTGTNTKPVQNLILLISGKSTIKYKQGLGRGTRIYPGKTHCNVIDFNVYNIDICGKHFKERLGLYQELSPFIKIHDLTSK